MGFNLNRNPFWGGHAHEDLKEGIIFEVVSCILYQSGLLMTDREEIMDSSDSRDNAPSAKKNGKTSLLDSGEDFEVVDEEDLDDDDPPPLEDAGEGKGKNTSHSEKKNVDSDPPSQVDEWLDVLGK